MSLKKSTKIFKALANERRLRILKHLFRGGNLTVGDISERIDLSFKSTSKHLLILENADLVLCGQTSSNVFYRLNHEIPGQLLNFLKNNL